MNIPAAKTRKPKSAPDQSDSGSCPKKFAPDLAPLARDMSGLKIDSKNANLHTEEQLDVLAGSLTRFGQVKPIVVNRDDGTIIAGNATFFAAQRLGWKTIAAVLVDPKKVDPVAYGLADNRIARMSELNDALVADLLRELGEADRAGLGWDDAELAALLEPIAQPAGPAEFANPEKNMVTQYQCPKCKYEWNGKPRS